MNWDSARGEFSGTETIVGVVIDSVVSKFHEHLKDFRATDGEWTYVQNDNDANDESGHGTMVAGISPKALILPIRLFDNAGLIATNSRVDVSVLISALDRARPYEARIINLSLGGPLCSFAERLSLSECYRANIP